ncbi:Two-component system, sensor histidine kinase [Saccharothrix espanaensis DSM 44229]|uniref:histidine kinase n=1 Tax=Saccharothrix espanaensis (strain ATCC 51144 / DSM 44229 / JCM 9112 / NBRC 15066 / NRRL 15764) TaxID=1179773 RepID=K0K0R1_SACES|nr:Two-component system, sensor histidine kinase [Saccharothrix espanaensis DSM 44229]
MWSAMAGSPLRFLGSAWPWRCVAHLSGTVAVGVVLWFPVLALLPALPLLGVPVGAVERRRLRLVDPAPAADPHLVAGPGVRAWLRRRLTEPATWRELGYALCLLTVLPVVAAAGLAVLLVALVLALLPVLFLLGGTVDLRLGPLVLDTFGGTCVVGLLIGVPATAVALYAVSALAAGQAAFARWLLTPTGVEQAHRVAELAASRTRLVGAFEAERRRIERDLHDGAQQHLVLLTMNLGLAEIELGDAHPRAGELVAAAREQARRALAAIREQIRGIHPRVLTDLGLPAALDELAERCPVPVRVGFAATGRLPDAVESTAYFVVSEALTNAVRHAGASRVDVGGGVSGGLLVVTVADDGRGGADPERGTGLRGLADRVAVAGGTLTVVSPAGGPTTLRLEVPCHCG